MDVGIHGSSVGVTLTYRVPPLGSMVNGLTILAYSSANTYTKEVGEAVAI